MDCKGSVNDGGIIGVEHSGGEAKVKTKNLVIMVNMLDQYARILVYCVH